MRDKKPRPGVVALIHDGAGKILMGRRKRGPENGKLVLPGGGIELGETVTEALIREVYEETGLRVVPRDLVPIDVIEIVKKKSHRICLVLAANALTKGVATESDELCDIDFYPADHSDVSAPVRASLSRLGLLS